MEEFEKLQIWLKFLRAFNKSGALIKFTSTFVIIKNHKHYDSSCEFIGKILPKVIFIVYDIIVGTLMCIMIHQNNQIDNMELNSYLDSLD